MSTYEPGPHVYRLVIADRDGRYEPVAIEGNLTLSRPAKEKAIVAGLIQEWSRRSPKTPILRLPLRDLTVSGSIDRAR